MSLSPQFLDELRSRTQLSALIGQSVKVKRAGREYKACCPFHDEKTPSFTINDAKGFYHCFGCGAHGDAIRWMTDQRGLAFMDAVRELAAHAGLEVPAADPRAARQAEQRAGLHDVMAAAQDWFEAELRGPSGAEARAYLDRRGISPALAAQMGFGLAPDSRTGIARALARFPVGMLVEAGLLIEVEDKTPYDRFRGRLMLPIRDARGRVIAFGGRILGDGTPKYLNSPDTPLFDKGRTLYNLHTAAAAARHAGRLIVVEGYMDAVALIGAGIGEVVAPLGTALTEAQLELAWRQVERPLLCFDGDSAGQRAAMRAATRALPLLKPGRSLDFVTLPAGRDPDDVVRDGGAAAFEALGAAREPLVERLWNHERAAAPLTTPEEKAGLKARLGEHVEAIGDAEIRRLYAAAFRERIDALFFPPRQWTPRGAAAGPRKPARAGQRPGPPPSPAGREARHIAAHGLDATMLAAILSGLIRYPQAIARYHEPLAMLRPADRHAAALLRALLSLGSEAGPDGDREGLDAGGLLTILGPDLRDRATALLRSDTLPFSFARRDAAGGAEGTGETEPVRAARAVADLGEVIRVMVERPAIERALAEAQVAAEHDLTDDSFAEQQRLLGAMRTFDRRLADLMQREDG